MERDAMSPSYAQAAAQLCEYLVIRCLIYSSVGVAVFSGLINVSLRASNWGDSCEAKAGIKSDSLTADRPDRPNRPDPTEKAGQDTEGQLHWIVKHVIKMPSYLTAYNWNVIKALKWKMENIRIDREAQLKVNQERGFSEPQPLLCPCSVDSRR